MKNTKFKKRLKYENYHGCEDIITIDLHNGYTIIAIKSLDKEKDIYCVELRIKENTVDKWDLIEKVERLEFKTNKINSVILKYVSTLLDKGFFNYYIERNEYELKCFDIGNEMIETSKKVYNPIKGKISYHTVYYCSNCNNCIELENEYCPHCKVSLNWKDIIDKNSEGIKNDLSRM